MQKNTQHDIVGEEVARIAKFKTLQMIRLVLLLFGKCIYAGSKALGLQSSAPVESRSGVGLFMVCRYGLEKLLKCAPACLAVIRSRP